MKELLCVMSEIMNSLDFNYDYLKLKKPLSYPYIIGEYYENDYVDETHCSKGEFLLTVWDRNISSLNIISLNQKIKDKFRDLKVIKNNVAIHLSYSSSLSEEHDSDDLKKKEIRIDVQYFERGE